MSLLVEQRAHLGDLGCLRLLDRIRQLLDARIVAASCNLRGHRQCPLVVHDHALEPEAVERGALGIGQAKAKTKKKK